MTRRELLVLTGQAALIGQTQGQGSDDKLGRIAKVIRDYEEQGIHRTATAVDKASGEWLAGEVRKIGLKPELESFKVSRVDIVRANVTTPSASTDGIPLFDGGFTDAKGVSGTVGPLASDAPIGYILIAPNTAGAGALLQARQENRHRAIIAITNGGRPGLCPSNAESFLNPFGPPVLQIPNKLGAVPDYTAEVTVTAHVKRTDADAFNVLMKIEGTDRSLPPLVIMTPRSGWWTCASERGGGIACWLEVMRALNGTNPARDVMFVASSGHELGQLGIETYAERRPDLIKRARAWIHFGANVGAAQDPGVNLQASDDEMERVMAEPMTAAGIKIDRRVPRGTVPGGEAGVVHRGGGRYLSIIGRNALFHNPADRGPEAVDVKMIAKFAEVFSGIAKGLAGA
jgi:Peptidase family M28